MILARFFSLLIIQSLPIKYVIIDASYIKGVTFDAANTAITKGTISMANELSLEACAEYLQSTNQIEFFTHSMLSIRSGGFQFKAFS